jgi:hypothetical protein
MAWRNRGLACALAVLCTASRAWAAEWWVDQASAPAGDGSAARPFQTINEVKNVLKTGDTVFIKSGTYKETVDFWHVPAGTGGRTTVRAALGAAPVIDGAGTTNFVLQAGETPMMTFQGLVIANGATGVSFYQADDGQVIDCTSRGTGGAISFYFASRGYVSGCKLEGSVAGKASDGTVIENSEIYGSAAEGITLHADSKNCRYSRNAVHDNTSVNIYLDSISSTVVDSNFVYMTNPTTKQTVGIMLADEAYPNVTSPKLQNITITNNVIVGNESGIRFWDGAFPGQSGLKNVVIANNTVVNNRTTAIKWDSGAHQATSVQNNIFAGQAGVELLLLQANSTAGVTLDHNLWWLPSVAEPMLWGATSYDHAGWVGAAGQGQADVTADPGLVGWGVDVASMRLAAASPAIDKGVAVAALAHDFDGAARPAGAAYDIGAFEYGAVTVDGGAGGSAPPAGAGGNGGGSAASGGAAGAGGSNAAAPAGEASGCGCRIGRGSVSGAIWIAVSLLLLGARRRRV